MNTVLRVKRKSQDVPMSSLVVGCKRPRTHFLSSDSYDPDVKTVAQFAGTLLDVTEDFNKVVPKVMNFEQLELAKSYKRMSDDEMKPYLAKKPKWIDVDTKVEKIKVSKYENPSRGKGEVERLFNNLAINTEEASEEKMMTFIDLKDAWSDAWSDDSLNTSDQWQGNQDKDDSYVYDLYYVEMDEDVWFDSTRIFIQHPKYSVYEDSEDLEDQEASSDSNSESNWRNDYPDKDPFDSDNASDNDSLNDNHSDKSSSSDDSMSLSEMGPEKSEVTDSSSTSSTFSDDSSDEYNSR